MNEFEPVDERIIISAFFEFMHRNGIYPRDNLTLIMDGKIHRFRTQNDKHGGESGRYFLYSDGWPNGGAMDYHIHHNGMIKFVLDKDLMPCDSRPVMSHEEYERMKAENEHRQQENIKRQKKNEQGLIEKAFAFFHSDSVNQNREAVNQHQYMRRKQVTLPPNSNCYAGIDSKGNLVFPLFDSELLKPFVPNLFKMQRQFSLQFIAPPDADGNSQKFFYKGIGTKGLWYPIRQSISNTLFVTEGIATAFSLDEFTHRKFSVAAAMNCGNLLEVCKNLRTYLATTNFANQQIIIAADNDANHAGEIAAKKVVEAGYADNYRMPPIVGMDWNDYINHLKGQQNNE